MAEINVDEEISKSRKAMESAEAALLKAGFPPQHWSLLKDYLNNAIVHVHWQIAKASHDFTPPSSQKKRA